MNKSTFCAKKTFKNRKQAKKIQKAINKEEGERRMKQVYFCLKCQGYHLSSMSKAEYLKMRNQ